MKKESIDLLIDYITDRYNKLEMNDIGGYNNISRHTIPIMSNYVENSVAIFINDVLKNKNYKYLIDSQLSVGKRKIVRPDIIIYEEKGEYNLIHAIIEVKSQLGYDRFNKTDYRKKINKIKKASKKELLKSKSKDKNEEIKYQVSSNCLDFVVILLKNNSRTNEKHYNGVKHFILFNKDAWYNYLEKNNIIYDGKTGLNELINEIKNI